nr:ShET2/EspL2 family type III secretion system effector toxin [Burkholderiales bacterium]
MLPATRNSLLCINLPRIPFTDPNISDANGANKAKNILQQIKNLTLKIYHDSKHKDSHQIGQWITSQLQTYNMPYSHNAENIENKPYNILDNDDMHEINSLYNELPPQSKFYIITEFNKWINKKSNKTPIRANNYFGYHIESSIITKFNNWINKKRNTAPILANNYLENHIAGITNSSSRVITQIKDSTHNIKIWSYQSKHGEPLINNNCKVLDKKNEKIACRQLAFWFLWNDAIYSDTLSNLNTYPSIDSLYYNDFDNLNCMHNFNRLSVATLDQVGTSLQKECENMQLGEEKHLIFGSESHSMSFKVHYKAQGYFTVKFYDPNKTTVHIRLVMRSPDDLQYLKITDLLPREDIKWYFAKFKAFTIATYDYANFVPPQQQTFNFLSITPDKLIEYTGLFYYAFKYGNENYVKDFINSVVNCATLDIKKKLELLSAKSHKGYSGLYIALANGHTNSVMEFINSILNSTTLNPQQKIDLLASKGPKGFPELYTALKNGNIK